MSEVLPTLITVVGSVGALWIVSRTWLQYKKGPTQSEDLAQVAEALELLQHSVDDLREDVRSQIRDVRDISGRVDFAERLLTRQSGGDT